MFILKQFVDVMAAIHSDHQMRDLTADVVLEGLGGTENVAFIPLADRSSAVVEQLR